MTLEIKFPRVLEPQSLRDLVAVYYQSMYEGKEEAKRLTEDMDSYCSDLSFKERAYMYTLMAKAERIANRMKKINRRKFVRKEKAEFDKTVALEEALVNKNNYAKELEEIKNCELEKADKELENKIKGIGTRRGLIRKGSMLIAPAATGASLYVGCEHLPAKIAQLAASSVGLGTATAFYLLDRREAKKAEKVTDKHYDKRRKIIQDCCEDQNGVERFYAKRVNQIEESYFTDRLKIENDKEIEEKRHISREIRNLERAWKTYGVNSKGVSLGTLIKMIS